MESLIIGSIYGEQHRLTQKLCIYLSRGEDMITDTSACFRLRTRPLYRILGYVFSQKNKTTWRICLNYQLFGIYLIKAKFTNKTAINFCDWSYYVNTFPISWNIPIVLITHSLCTLTLSANVPSTFMLSLKYFFYCYKVLSKKSILKMDWNILATFLNTL